MKWWDTIATWLSKSDKRLLVILKHDESYSDRFPHRQDQVIRPLREKFLSFSTLKDEAKKQIESRILIGINNDVFSMKLFNFAKFEEEIKKLDEAEETPALV